MAISYRQRGKKKNWDYRIFDKNKKVVASNSGFKTKKEAMLEASKIELELLNGNVIDSNISLYQLWEKWYNLQIVPLNKSQGTIAHHKHRGKLILIISKINPLLISILVSIKNLSTNTQKELEKIRFGD